MSSFLYSHAVLYSGQSTMWVSGIHILLHEVLLAAISFPQLTVFAATRMLLTLTVAVLSILLLERRWKVATNFLQEQGTAANLAIARIVVMITLLVEVRYSEIIKFSRLDSALLVPFQWWGFAARHLPRQPGLLTITYIAFLVCGTFGLVGFKTKWSCLIAGLCGLYLLSLAQMFGKVNHTQHATIVFTFLLAAFPSSDTLSLDSVRDAWRRGKNGYLLRTKHSREYALPLQAMMLFIGLAYFFPGAWKLSRAWMAWFTAGHLRYLMANKLAEIGVSPFQRWFAAHPFFLLLGAYFTIFFELAFIFAVLCPVTRAFAALGGLLFHNLITLLMGIQFGAMQAMYVVFFDWTEMLGWIATRRKQGPLTVFYAADLATCRGIAGLLSVFDWLDLLTLVPSPLTQDLSSEAVENIFSVGSRRIFATGGASDEKAYSDVISEVAARIPVLWPLIPLLGVRLVQRLGRRFITRLVESSADVTSHTSIYIGDTLPVHRYSSILKKFAVAPLVGMVLSGLTHSVDTWPISCYPPFDLPGTSDYIDKVSLQGVDVYGGLQSWTLSFDPVMGRELGSERWRALLSNLNRNNPPSPLRTKAILRLWMEYHPLPLMSQVVVSSDRYRLSSSFGEMDFVSRQPLIAIEDADLR